MNFRLKFNLSTTATEVLIKFMRLVLIEISSDKFKRVCKSLNKTKQFLGLSDKFISFVACPKCHKLYKEDEVTDFQRDDQVSIMKCTHIEFPNATTVRKRKVCGTNLSTQSKLLNGAIVNRPELIFPFSPIRQQLANMYKRPGLRVIFDIG